MLRSEHQVSETVSCYSVQRNTGPACPIEHICIACGSDESGVRRVFVSSRKACVSLLKSRSLGSVELGISSPNAVKPWEPVHHACTAGRI